MTLQNQLTNCRPTSHGRCQTHSKLRFLASGLASATEQDIRMPKLTPMYDPSKRRIQFSLDEAESEPWEPPPQAPSA